MQRLNTTLAPLWSAAKQNQTEADRAEHRRQVRQMLIDADNIHKETIPEYLHRAGPQRLRPVSADDIIRLRLGRSLALATRSLLSDGAGNQRLPVAASQGDAMATMFGIREAALQGLAERDAIPAIAVLAQGGACLEHSSVVFELASSLDLPVGTANDDEDHGVVVLHPELGGKAVVVDAWTTFPGSCLMEDSNFMGATLLRRHQPGMTHVGNLNLPMVQRLREQLDSALGPKPILNAMLEEFESSHPDEFDGLTTAHQRRERLSDVTLHESANSIISAAQRDITLIGTYRGQNNGILRNPRSQLWQNLHHRARVATAPMLSVLQSEVVEAAQHTVQRSAAQQRNCSVRIDIPPDEFVDVNVAMTVRAWPGLRDTRLTSGNFLYSAGASSRFSTTAAPARVIAAAAEGVIASEALNFPDGYR